MPITFKQKVAVLEGNCEVDLAEELDHWLAENQKRQVNMKQLEHAHTSVFQVLLMRKPSVSVWPQKPELAWFESAYAAFDSPLLAADEG